LTARRSRMVRLVHLVLKVQLGRQGQRYLTALK
jgi:hypothetical protein